MDADLDRRILPRGPEPPQVGRQHRLHRGRHDPEVGKAAGAVCDDIVGAQALDLVAGDHARHDAQRQGRGDLEPEPHQARGKERDVQDQPTAADHAQHPLHERAEAFGIRAAHFVDARCRGAGDGHHRGLGHVVDIGGLEPGIGAHDRQHRTKPGHAREPVEEAVLGSEQDRGAQDHGIGARGQNGSLSGGLGPLVFAGAFGIRADGRDVHDAADAFFGGDAGDAGGAVMLDSLEVVAPAAVEGAHAVDHRRGARHGRAHGCVIADVAQDRLDLADRAVGLDEQRLVRATDRHAHAPTFLGHATSDVTPEKTRTAVDRDQLRHRPPSGKTCWTGFSPAPGARQGQRGGQQ
jgi:hypothetical protein